MGGGGGDDFEHIYSCKIWCVTITFASSHSRGYCNLLVLIVRVHIEFYPPYFYFGACDS